MRTISTGQPSTLETYRTIATFFGEDALAFIDKQIADSPNGEKEEVVADESQVLYLLANIKGMDNPPSLVPKELFEL